ncbi:MAG: preprotein translocase subunit SecE [Armatimonadetes bacterium]|nr:preprotein translocase subunit SecE [Armatimonadota bacterium]
MSDKQLPTPDMKRGPRAFFKDLQREVRMITWPTPQETTRLTGTVLGVCVLVVVLLFGLSLAIEQLFRLIGVGR